MDRGPNERALGTMLTARGVSRSSPGDLAALVTLARTLARVLDATDEPSAGMASAYLSTLRKILELTKPEQEVEGEQPAAVLRRLRSV